jgi:alpha-L-fucosidase 2
MNLAFASLIAAGCLSLGSLAAAVLPSAVPPPALNLKLTAPIATWDEAVPLGNGLMGGLVWGQDSTLRLSLDRGDLWDERTHGEPNWWTNRTFAKGSELVGQRQFDTVIRWWDDPYNGVTPTKLPAGRLEITLDPALHITSFELNLATAEGWAHLADGRKIEIIFSAKEPIALLRIPTPAPATVSLKPSGAKREAGDTGPSSGGAVSKLGYPPAATGRSGEIQWFEQTAAQGFTYAAAVGQRQAGNATLLAVAVTASTDGGAPKKLAEARVKAALAKGFTTIRKEHADWWSRFWSQSSVSLPSVDFAIAQQYYLVRYFYGAASRRGAPPMPLQGVWTADNGGLPPWKGDYHNDLNTQMTYIAYPAAGHFDEGLAYLDFLWDRRSVFTAFARDFYRTPGLACPGVMSLAGQPLGGWGMYSMSPTMSAWSAHLFYLHWRYTMDDTFLRQRAWPWSRDVGLCMKGLLRTNVQGVLVLPLSSSPEIFDNTPRAWLTPNSNYDLMSLRMLFLALAEMADAQGLGAEARQWSELSQRLGPYHVRDDGTLKISSDENLPGSHRHLSNLMGLHPFNLINIDNPDAELRVIDPTLAEWDKFGSSAWCGYSYSWMSALRARVGRAEEAVRLLDIYAKAFVLRNGFHANGDQTKSGFSSFTYRPFTLEGNFLAMHAVHEMLLQSWSPSPGKRDTEVIRLFPAAPWRWHDVAFNDLRAEGGYRVSAQRVNNATTWFRIVATRDGVLRLRDNFGDRTPSWNRKGVKKIGPNYQVQVRAGDRLEATLLKPGVIPPEPANAAKTIVINHQ